MLKMGNLVHVVTFLTWILEVPSLNLSWDTTVTGFLWFCSIPSGKYQDNTLYLVMTSFHILSCSLFTVIQSWHHIVWVPHKQQINHTVLEKIKKWTKAQVQRVICIPTQPYCLCRSKSDTEQRERYSQRNEVYHFDLLYRGLFILTKNSTDCKCNRLHYDAYINKI